MKERLAQFTPEVQNSYFGQILDKQLLVLKNIEVGFAPAEFTVTDKDDRKVSLSDYKGKYVLIYHWGLCPGTFWVNPKIMDLYQKYHEKGLEVLGFTRDDLLKSLQGSSEEFKKDEPRKKFLESSASVIKAIKGTAEFGAAIIALIQFLQQIIK